MIQEYQGNLFDVEVDAIMHQCNCYGMMGAGVAAQVKKHYPLAFRKDIEFMYPYGASRLGRVSHAKVQHMNTGADLMVYNLYGQVQYGKGKHTVELELLKAAETAFNHLRKTLPNASKVGIPKLIGAGLGGGDWSLIYKGFKKLAKEYKFELHIVELKR